MDDKEHPRAAGRTAEGTPQLSHVKVAELLDEAGYSLQAQRKTKEGADHPDRDEQFRHINERAKEFLQAGDPVISVASIERWWKTLGNKRYPHAKRLLVTADSGGSNGYRLRLWKKELQRFADFTGLEVSVCHYPPGTSKWNKI